MFRLSAKRQVVRSFVRHESTATKVTEKVSQQAAKVQEQVAAQASKVQEKAQEQVSAATSKAGAALSGAGATASKYMSGVMGMQESAVYWTKVAGQIAKQVYTKEKMSPPSMAHLEATYKTVMKNMSASGMSNMMKGMSAKDAAKLGVDGLIIYGFFCVGEMVGRRNLVGYSV